MDLMENIKQVELIGCIELVELIKHIKQEQLIEQVEIRNHIGQVALVCFRTGKTNRTCRKGTEGMEQA